MYSHHHHHRVPLMILGMVTALVLYPGGLLSPVAGSAPFEKNFAIVYGQDHFKFLNRERTEVQLWMDTKSGAGFGTKVKYESGYFRMDIKLSSKDTAGVIVAFYLQSGNYKEDEVDFEFMGNEQGKAITVQTNVFADGRGDREQRIVFPFKLSDRYHKYEILWNPHIIVLFVDGYPARVYKNNRALGVAFPSKPMQLLCTIWDGDYWATNGGRTKINWAHAPFTAQFKGFDVQGCVAGHDCGSQNYWWNRPEYWGLDRRQQSLYEWVRGHFRYDYCTDRKRSFFRPPECASNS